MPTIRSASLTGYVDVARAAGLDPHRLLRDAGIRPAALADPETRVSVAAVRRLLETTAQVGNIPDLGLQMARLRRLSSLGPVSLLLREEPTARRALDTLAQHMRLVNDSLITRVEAIEDRVIIREEFALGEPVPVRQSMELAVGVMYQILHELLGPRWKPLEVCFTHSAPADLTSHLRLFGRSIEFDQDFNGIVCAASDLEARNPSADPAMARYARAYIETILAEPDQGSADRVRRLIHSLLPTGRCTIERIATELGVDRRTVHRHLQAEGTTFSAELHAVRLELAARYLLGGDRPANEIGAALGFAAPSAFSRWFSQAFGVGPARWRAHHDRRALAPHERRQPGRDSRNRHQ